MMREDIKYCSKCGVGKPATEDFFSMRSDINILYAQCKECRTKKRREQYLNNREKALCQNKQWKENNKERRNEVHKKWYTQNKERILHHSRVMYHANIDKERERNKKYRESHKETRNIKRRERHLLINEKENKQSREWYLNNKDKHLENGRKWRKNNRDKARSITERYRAAKFSNGGSYTQRDVCKKYAMQMGKCFYCGESLKNNYHVDHVVPLSRGGSNYCGNIVISCPSCNSSKGNKFLIEWKVYRARIA